MHGCLKTDMYMAVYGWRKIDVIVPFHSSQLINFLSHPFDIWWQYFILQNWVMEIFVMINFDTHSKTHTWPNWVVLYSNCIFSTLQNPSGKSHLIMIDYAVVSDWLNNYQLSNPKQNEMSTVSTFSNDLILRKLLLSSENAFNSCLLIFNG